MATLPFNGTLDQLSNIPIANATANTNANNDISSLPGLESNPTTVEYQKKDGITSGAGAGIIVRGTQSIFNPFYVFRYSLFGSTDGRNYDANLHKNIRSLSTVSNQSIADSNRLFARSRTSVIENPSASVIIDWAKKHGDKNGSATIMGPTPYQWSDFLWCKYYGKIPNNKLITLRRYPIPVEDNLQIATEKMPLIPIAQAVTWWGEGTGNTLDSVLGMTYGLNWNQDQSFGDVRSVDGNEVSAEAVLDVAGLSQANANVRQFLLSALFDNPTNPFDQTAGMDQEIQNWIKTSYEVNGPYWNRVLGPVNVIENTTIRKRGMTFTKEIQLTFTYKLRAYANVNPKVAMLDLINNFMSLTYNNADFYGGAIRYFQKTGYILPGLPTNKFELGDFVGGTLDVVQYLMATIGKKAAELSSFINSLGSVSAGGGVSGVLEELGNAKLTQQIVGAWISKLMQKPLQMRGFLDGRATGEWHLTVGNPLNPIATIGNLCLKSTKISFSDTLGLDDFPTEVKFTVDLVHGRARAKQDIISMFNLGGGPMYYTELPQPSSAFNSLGEFNSIAQNNARGIASFDNIQTTGSTTTGAGGSFVISPDTAGDLARDAARGASGPGQFTRGQNVSLADATAIAAGYKDRVKRAYGPGYANSPILIDYFRDVKTKD